MKLRDLLVEASNEDVSAMAEEYRDSIESGWSSRLEKLRNTVLKSGSKDDIDTVYGGDAYIVRHEWDKSATSVKVHSKGMLETLKLAIKSPSRKLPGAAVYTGKEYLKHIADFMQQDGILGKGKLSGGFEIVNRNKLSHNGIGDGELPAEVRRIKKGSKIKVDGKSYIADGPIWDAGATDENGNDIWGVGFGTGPDDEDERFAEWDGEEWVEQEGN